MRQCLRITILCLALLLFAALAAQAIGVSFSYLLPRNGLFSHPVPPLSLRDIGIDFGRYLGTAGSLSLYSVRGMGITDSSGQPIEAEGPLVGPFLFLLGSVAGKVRIPIEKFEVEASGGFFGGFTSTPRLVEGNLDRYLASASGVDSVTSTVSAGGRWAWGWLVGAKATYFITPQVGIALGANYYRGGGPLKLSGSYDGYDGGGLTLADEALPANLQEARLDFTGVELILGVDVEL